MSTIKIELGKFYMTRGGFRARIYSIENGLSFPFHGAVNLGGDEWGMMCWRHDNTATSSFTVSGREYLSDEFDITGPWLYRSRIALTQPTPGPWRVSDKGEAVVADYCTGNDDSDGVKYYGGHLVCESATQENLHLIAAAPELYEACREAVAFIRHYAPDEHSLAGRLHNAVCSAEGIPF